MSELVRIVEKRSVPSNALMLHGLPDVGLVGLIATSHIIGELNMSEIAYGDSELNPEHSILYEFSFRTRNFSSNSSLLFEKSK